MRVTRLSSIILLALVPVLSFGLTASAKTPAMPRTYTVMVGLENPHQGIGVMAYFPESVTIHVGDTVHWVQNTNEIHTVTFLAGVPFPELLIPSNDISISPLMFNPMAVDPVVPANGEYDGTTYTNSGLMGREPGQVGEFDLTFTSVGTYGYVCLVHGTMMSGMVIVVSDTTQISSPNQVMAEGDKQMAKALSMVPAVVKEANEKVELPEMNPDGSITHYVKIGYSAGQIDLMQFFPDKLTVRPGDKIVWELSENDVAPHTVTFLNDEPEPPLAVFENGYLYLNKDVLLPTTIPPYLPAELTRSGIFNSGLIAPGSDLTTFTLVVGDMTPGLEPYLCLLHDTSGMNGTLMIVPAK
jgi:plastocyanin